MDRFSRIYVEITNICNLSCSFCAGNSREPMFMNCEEFACVLRQIRPFTRHIYLHVLGEPLLHPQLDELLDIAFEQKMLVNITTNGTLLANRMQMLLQKPSLRKVSISLHSLEGVGANEQTQYLKTVADFAQSAAEKGILCDLRLWNLGVEDVDNHNIFSAICDYFKLDPDTISLAKAKLSSSGNVTLAPRIFLGTAPRFEWPTMSSPLTNENIFCFGMRNHVGILCDGTVVPCCLDSNGDIPLGNIFQTAFPLIIECSRAQNLYNGFSARRPSEQLCLRCKYATRF